MNTFQKKTNILASAGLLATAVIWGFAFVVVKNSLDAVSPIYMLAFRFTIAVMVLAVIFANRLKNLNKTLIIEGMVLGFLLFASYLVQTIGCKYTTAGKNAFLTTVYVVLVPFLHWAINKKKPNGYCITAAFMAITGIGFLSLQGDLSINIGDALTLICGLGFAFHMLYIDRFTKQHDPVLLAVLQLFFAAIFSWVAALFGGGGFPQGAFTSPVVISMLYLGVFSSALGFLFQTVGQKYTSPSTTSLLLSLEAVFGVVFSIIFLDERLTGRMIAGCTLIFMAIIIAETQLDFLPVKKKEQV